MKRSNASPFYKTTSILFELDTVCIYNCLFIFQMHQLRMTALNPILQMVMVSLESNLLVYNHVIFYVFKEEDSSSGSNTTDTFISDG